MDIVFYLIQGTLPVAIPLFLVALGGMFSERSGVINIGLEGIMLSGGFLGCLFVYFIQGTNLSPQLILLLGMIVAALSGAIYSALLSFAAINMKADQTIVGTALNMLIPAAILLVLSLFFPGGIIAGLYKFYQFIFWGFMAIGNGNALSCFLVMLIEPVWCMLIYILGLKKIDIAENIKEKVLYKNN